MNSNVINFLALLIILGSAIVLAYMNYYRRLECIYKNIRPDLSKIYNRKWHRYQAFIHVSICVLPLFGTHWLIIPTGLMLIWTVFDFVYSLLTFRSGITSRGIWEFGTTATLDRLQAKIFRNGKVAFAVKIVVTVGLITLYFYATN